MRSPFSLAGRTALVTGANTGLGQAIAVALGQAGASVICVGRSPMDETLAKLAEAGAAALEIRADLSEMAALQPVVEQASAWKGRIDCLVNNAGIIRRAEAVDANPGGERELRPLTITADVEFQVIANMDELGCVRAGPAALHAAVNARQFIRCLEIEQCDECGIVFQLRQR
jgi:NAD(P)-dependent dehydrogenase (short-subunit alcohol dehydrogenase family)